MSRHKWKTQRAGGPPDVADSYEMVTYCDKCGTELDDDNKDSVCEVDVEDEPAILR